MYIIRRAQSRIDQATLENEVADWDNARSGRPSRQPSGRRLIEERCIFRPTKTPDPFLWLRRSSGSIPSFVLRTQRTIWALLSQQLCASIEYRPL